MPIKSCSRCGLKVLVDAQAAATDNFLCTRCAPDAKPASAPASRPSGGGKRPTVKVACPYCGASFSGSIPSRPAKGGCPVCQKELVLLPDGTIQAAASFNLTTWQKDKKSASNPPAPAPSGAPVEMPSTPDPLGGSTILDMGGPPGGAPPPPPTIDDQTIAIPGGLGDQTMLGMGAGSMGSPPPTIEEPQPEAEPEPDPEPPTEEMPEPPPDLGGATILDMAPGPIEIPSTIEDMSPKPDLLSDTMPGYDRPPSAESPVEPPLPPPIPEDSVPVMESPPEVTDGPTIRDEEVAPPEEPAPEPEPEPEPVLEEPTPASIESAPEIPADLGGQTILDMGMESRHPEPVPSIEEPPPEAVPILAKDVESPDSPMPDADAEPEPAAPEPAAEKPYVYQPIARTPRKPPPSLDPVPSSRALPPTPSAPPPPPPSTSAPVLGSDFRIAAPPPEPKPSPEKSREEKRPAGPKTAAVVLPRAQNSLKVLVIAWTLLLLPGAAGFLMYSMQKNSAVEKVIERLKKETMPGIQKMDGEIRKSITKPAEPPPESK